MTITAKTDIKKTCILSKRSLLCDLLVCFFLQCYFTEAMKWKGELNTNWQKPKQRFIWSCFILHMSTIMRRADTIWSYCHRHQHHRHRYLCIYTGCESISFRSFFVPSIRLCTGAPLYLSLNTTILCVLRVFEIMKVTHYFRCNIFSGCCCFFSPCQNDIHMIVCEQKGNEPTKNTKNVIFDYFISFRCSFFKIAFLYDFFFHSFIFILKKLKEATVIYLAAVKMSFWPKTWHIS